MTDPQFWHQRWRSGQIGFHRDDVHPALPAFWHDVAAGAAAPVLVPLAGKSLDMRWLAARGHPVTGVELDEIAVRSFFVEAGRSPRIETDEALPRWEAGGVTLYQGDFFDFWPEAPFELFYDRAALIALPRDARDRYLEHLAAQLSPGARGLLVTLEYPQEAMDGPPFSVPTSELAGQSLFDIEVLAREDVLDTHPRFAEKGLSHLYECCYRLTRREPR